MVHFPLLLQKIRASVDHEVRDLDSEPRARQTKLFFFFFSDGTSSTEGTLQEQDVSFTKSLDLATVAAARDVRAV